MNLLFPYFYEPLDDEETPQRVASQGPVPALCGEAKQPRPPIRGKC